jgi:hypothetical protein
MLLEGECEQVVLISIYVIVSAVINGLSENSAIPRLGGSVRGRKPDLDFVAVVTLALFRYALNIKDVKHYHRYLLSHYRGWFKFPNYPNFNAQLNEASPYAAWVVLWICFLNRVDYSNEGDSGPCFIDTTPLKVCEKGRMAEHKVCKGLAKKSKSTQGWYFGFKLGVVVDLAGRLMSVALGPGNMDDRKFLSFLFENIEGLAVGDAGFVSKDWMKILYEKGLFFITDVKKNMKRLMTPAQHRLLKSRQNVEIRLSQLKHRLQQGVTIARSPKGYFSRWIYATLSYCIFPLVESYFG